MTKDRRKRAGWLVFLVLVIGAFIIGGTSRPSQSLEARTERVANTLKCPVCSGESVADSQVSVAQSMREEISTKLLQGQTPDTIRAFFVSRYGPDILLKPKTSGLSLAVWLVPAVVALAVVCLVVMLLSRWRNQPVIDLSDEEQREVEKALGV